MPKKDPNPITDEEVQIIKNLLDRGIENQKILGFVNRSRPLAHINNGRIAEIRKGRTLRYRTLLPSSNEVADNFIRMYGVEDEDPLSDDRLYKLLPIRSVQPLTLNITETVTLECKKTFHRGGDYIKTIAGFANNSGGYFVFGVEDKTWSVLGLQNDHFETFDFKDLNQQILSMLGVDLQIRTKVVLISGVKVGIWYVPPASIKPLVCLKQKGDVSEGHIYYRYSGESRLISGSDLQRVIEDRVKQLSNKLIVEHFENLVKQYSSQTAGN